MYKRYEKYWFLYLTLDGHEQNGEVLAIDYYQVHEFVMYGIKLLNWFTDLLLVTIGLSELVCLLVELLDQIGHSRCNLSLQES